MESNNLHIIVFWLLIRLSGLLLTVFFILWAFAEKQFEGMKRAASISLDLTKESDQKKNSQNSGN